MTDETIEVMTPNQPKSFLSVLAEQGNGHVVAEMSRELHSLVEAMNDHFDKFRGKVVGSLSLNLKFTMENGAVKVETTYASSRPKAPAAGTIMWVDRDGNLGTSNPRQLSMPFTTATPIKR